MDENVLKKVTDMLLGGATMVREPCPYCGGVRVIKEGNALCAGCGREPDGSISVPEAPRGAQRMQAGAELESRLTELANLLESETDEDAKDAILDEIGAINKAITEIRRGGSKR